MGNLKEVLERLEARVEEAKVRAADRAQLERELLDKVILPPSVPLPGPSKQITSSTLVQHSQFRLFELEQRGLFTSYPLQPQSEFPRLLSRLPIFRPTHRITQNRLVTIDNGIAFETPWGGGIKYGPPLTIYDEDVLIALLRLRQKRLVGPPHNLPCRVSDTYKEKGQDEVAVHSLYCTVTEILDVLRQSHGGKNYRNALAAVRRLSNVSIEIFTPVKDDSRPVGRAGRRKGRGTSIKLLDVLWDEYERDALLYVQFTPIVAHWLEREYVYIDLTLRSKLSDTGKAVYRFLASQPRHRYAIFLEKLATTIGYERRLARFKHELINTMERLRSEGWVTEYTVTGTGRKQPYKLVVSHA